MGIRDIRLGAGRQPRELRGYTVYVLACSDGTLYTGVTSDMGRRLAQHNSGRASKYTRSRRPVSVFYREEVDSLSLALKREIQIKKMGRAAKLRLQSEMKHS